MSRYIDADIILARLQARTKFFPYDSATEDTVNTVTYWINGELEKQKDVAPVIHAHWDEFSDYTGTHYAECSRCGLLWWIEEGTAEENEMYYCPKCGAKMDEEVDNA